VNAFSAVVRGNRCVAEATINEKGLFAGNDAVSEKKRVIAFSLWGSNPKYTVGAVKNAELAKTIYPGWTCRFYVGTSVPEQVLRSLQSFEHCEIVTMGDAGGWKGMVWRFLAAGDDDVDVVLSRDTDSRLGVREKAAVDDWLRSDKDFHIMRDHPQHTAIILGGLWGARNDILRDIASLIDNSQLLDAYQTDQVFLQEFIYPRIRDRALVHDEFFEKKPFPTPRRKWEFVGEVFDQFDCSVLEHEIALERALPHGIQTK